MEDKQFGSAVTEAANRAEATALLIRCGYRVYRPEADIYGEDLVVLPPDGVLHGVQLKGRLTVDLAKYGNRNLSMLFPSAQYSSSSPRRWFMVPHDLLFDWIKQKHGHAPKWSNNWSYPSLPKDSDEFLQPYLLVPLTEMREHRFTVRAEDLEIIDKDGNTHSIADIAQQK